MGLDIASALRQGFDRLNPSAQGSALRQGFDRLNPSAQGSALLDPQQIRGLSSETQWSVSKPCPNPSTDELSSSSIEFSSVFRTADSVMGALKELTQRR